MDTLPTFAALASAAMIAAASRRLGCRAHRKRAVSILARIEKSASDPEPVHEAVGMLAHECDVCARCDGLRPEPSSAGR